MMLSVFGNISMQSHLSVLRVQVVRDTPRGKQMSPPTCETNDGNVPRVGGNVMEVTWPGRAEWQSDLLEVVNATANSFCLSCK